MRPDRLAVVLFALVLSAGCAAPTATLEPGIRGPEDIQSELAAVAKSLTEVSALNWHHLSLKASPEGNVTAYRWIVPNRTLFPVGGESKEVRLTLEFAPDVDNASKERLEGFAVFVFREQGDRTHFYSADVRPALRTTFRGANAPAPVASPPSYAPFFVQFQRGDLSAGTEFEIVVAAKGPSTVTFGLGLRALDHALSQNEKPAPDFESFVKAQKGRAPLPFNPFASGKGLQLAYYLETNQVHTRGVETRSTDVQVQDKANADQRPAVVARELTLSAQRDTPRGWTFAQGSYVGSVGVASFAIDVDARGTKFSRSGETAGLGVPFGGFLHILVLRPGSYFVVGDGEGAGRSSFRLTMAEVNTNQVVYFVQADLDVTLEALLGRPFADHPSTL